VVVVAAVRSGRAVLTVGVTLGNRRRNQRPDGALRFDISDLPIQAVVLPVIAENLLSVLAALRGVVFLFRRDERLANVNGGHFILANPPV
jgi:hypothetical protein